MIFVETEVKGAFLIKPQPLEDERGFFARTYCRREFEEHGLDPEIVQSSLSYNRRRGTLRGLHFQASPHEENKLISCRRGTVYDVIVDLRAGSPSFRCWAGITLTATGFEALFVPKGCAHGFITLDDDTVVQYEISQFHHPESSRGHRFDDPAFGIEWPIAPLVISPRDLGYPPYAGA
jgi:dTDP-4-dehydrorhamnose 3,5-epimerase